MVHTTVRPVLTVLRTVRITMAAARASSPDVGSSCQPTTNCVSLPRLHAHPIVPIILALGYAELQMWGILHKMQHFARHSAAQFNCPAVSCLMHACLDNNEGKYAWRRGSSTP